MNKDLDELEKLIVLYKTCCDIRKQKTIYLSIIEEAIPLVKKIANAISFQSGMNNEDLIQVGSIGLIKAVSSYKLNSNAKFRTYATYFIKGEIKHYLRDKSAIIRPPRELQELVFTISAANKKLMEDGIENPSAEDIADIIDLPVKKIEEVLNIDNFRNNNHEINIIYKI